MYKIRWHKRTKVVQRLLSAWPCVHDPIMYADVIKTRMKWIARVAKTRACSCMLIYFNVNCFVCYNLYIINQQVVHRHTLIMDHDNAKYDMLTHWNQSVDVQLLNQYVLIHSSMSHTSGCALQPMHMLHVVQAQRSWKSISWVLSSWGYYVALPPFNGLIQVV